MAVLDQHNAAVVEGARGCLLRSFSPRAWANGCERSAKVLHPVGDPCVRWCRRWWTRCRGRWGAGRSCSWWGTSTNWCDAAFAGQHDVEFAQDRPATGHRARRLQCAERCSRASATTTGDRARGDGPLIRARRDARAAAGPAPATSASAHAGDQPHRRPEGWQADRARRRGASRGSSSTRTARRRGKIRGDQPELLLLRRRGAVLEPLEGEVNPGQPSAPDGRASASC